MFNLRVNFAGIEVESPIGVAPMAPYSWGTPEQLCKLYLNFVNEGASFVYTPMICNEEKRPTGLRSLGRFLKMEVPGWGKETLLTISSMYNVMYRLEEGIQLINCLKKKLPRNIPVIAGITSPWSFDEESWVDLGREIQDAGANIIELDVSCPLAASNLKPQSQQDEKKLPSGLLGDNPKSLAPIVRAVAEDLDVPVGVKLTPETGYPRLLEIARLTKREGGKFVTSINSPLTIAPPDIFNRGKPRFQGFDYIPMAGVHGPANRYLCYKHVGTISKFIPDIDVAAVGGLVHPSHMIEAIMLGAKIVELCSGFLWKGMKIIRSFKSFLERYMQEEGYTSIEEFRRLGLEYILPSEIHWPNMIAQIEEEKCVGCKICAENLCWAITDRQGKIAIDETQCSGCSLCVSICPVGALSLFSRT